jgi:apolipoprotein N-acyltransferase
VLTAIAEMLPEGTTLITGAARPEPGLDRSAEPQVFNSIYVLSDSGEILDAYDKVHLVPFGEYLPFRGVFDFLGIRQLIDLPGGFAAGTQRRTIDLPHAPPFGPLICYEIVFAGEVTDRSRRPAWLLNLTNDTWFGATPGPYQHFQQARVRAVEEGLPLVRAANSGISAIVDPYGRIVESLGLGLSGVVDGNLPAEVGETIYARAGDLIFLIFLVLTAGIVGASQFRRRVQTD